MAGVRYVGEAAVTGVGKEEAEVLLSSEALLFGAFRPARGSSQEYQAGWGEAA